MRKRLVQFIIAVVIMAIGSYGWTLTADEAITRFKANEDRIDTWVNDLGYYTSSGSEYVETIRTLIQRKDTEISERYILNVKGAWAGSTPYIVNDLVSESSQVYLCVTAHTSGTFADDLAAGYWVWYQGFSLDGLYYANSTVALTAAVGAASVDHIVVTAPITLTANLDCTGKHISFIKGGIITLNTYNLTLSSMSADDDQIFVQTSSGKVILTAGATTEIKVSWWGTDTAAMNAAFDAPTTNDYRTWRFTPGVTYTVTAEVTAAIDDYCWIFAEGAQFTGSYAGIWFDLSDTIADRPLKSYWIGGEFLFDSATTSSAATAIRFWGVNQAGVRDIQCTLFNICIDTNQFESFDIANNRFVYSNYGLYEQQSAAADETSQNLFFHHNTCTSDITMTALKSCVSLNGPSKDHKLQSNTVAGYFSEGAFRLGDSLSISNLGVLAFNVVIADNHFENMKYPAVYAYHNGNAAGFAGVAVERNEFRTPVTNTDAVSLIKFESVLAGSISGNSTTVTAGATNTTYVELDADSGPNIHINFDNGYTDADFVALISYACARSDFKVIPTTRMLTATTVVTITDFSGASFSDATGTIDMSSKWSQFPTEAPPTGYWIKIAANDEDSSTITCSVILKDVVGTPDSDAAVLNLYGAVDDQVMQGLYYVMADANGDIYYSFNATGSSTLDIILTVMGYTM